MRIGYMRQSMKLELDYKSASPKILGTELRLGFLEALVLLGHKVFILNQLDETNQDILYGSGEGFDYKSFRNIMYRPQLIPKMDLLIIECSSANILFGGKVLARMKDVLSNYEGKVVFWQHSDNLCSLPLGAIKDGEFTDFQDTPKPSFNNYFKGVNYFNKQWILLTHAIPERLVERVPNRRYRYDAFNHYISIPIGYSKVFDSPKIKPLEGRKYDLIYFGKEKTKHRLKRMDTLYGREYCSKVLYGNWDSPPDDFDYKGEVSPYDIIKKNLYAKAKASIVIGDSNNTYLGLIPSRAMQSMRAGCLTLVDAEFNRTVDYVGEEYVVRDYLDVEYWLKLKDSEIAGAISNQIESIPLWKDILDRSLNEIIRL